MRDDELRPCAPPPDPSRARSARCPGCGTRARIDPDDLRLASLSRWNCRACGRMGLMPCSPSRGDRTDGVLSPGRPPRIPRAPGHGTTALAEAWRKRTLAGDARCGLSGHILLKRRPAQIGYAACLAPGRPDLVEDLVQDAQIATFLALQGWRPGIPFSPAFEEREAIWNAYVRWWRPSHDGARTAPATIRETKHAFRRRVLQGDLEPAGYPPAARRDPFAPRPIDWRRLGARALEEAGNLLDPRDLRILKARFFEEKTLDEVARREGVSKERVRQMKARALSVLRIRLRHLSPWGDGRRTTPPDGRTTGAPQIPPCPVPSRRDGTHQPSPSDVAAAGDGADGRTLGKRHPPDGADRIGRLRLPPEWRWIAQSC